MPASVVLVELGPLDGGAGPEVGPEAELVDAGVGVGQDLGLVGEAAGPVRLGEERERVQMGRHIAGAARIGVVPPGAAHPV